MSQENERRARELVAHHGPLHEAPLAKSLDEAEARAAVKWMPASEPPNTSRDVLVVTPDDMGKPCQWVAHYDGGWCCVGEYDPTHWMDLPPLPEPPTPTTEKD